MVNTIHKYDFLKGISLTLKGQGHIGTVLKWYGLISLGEKRLNQLLIVLLNSLFSGTLNENVLRCLTPKVLVRLAKWSENSKCNSPLLICLTFPGFPAELLLLFNRVPC
jgi:hypothetical protein